MKTKIEHLREHLFLTLEKLHDEEKPMELDRAKAISEVGQTIINSAKAEVAFMKEANTISGSGFFQQQEEQPPAIGASPKVQAIRN